MNLDVMNLKGVTKQYTSYTILKELYGIIILKL